MSKASGVKGVLCKRICGVKSCLLSKVSGVKGVLCERL